MTLSELFFGEAIGDTADLQTIIYHISVDFEFFCMLSKRISSFSYCPRNEREPNGEVYKILVLRDVFGVVFQSATLSIWQGGG